MQHVTQHAAQIIVESNTHRTRAAKETCDPGHGTILQGFSRCSQFARDEFESACVQNEARYNN